MISVIIPIYKVEKELNRCIDSIINQSYNDLEIILVNDGSPDNCPIICDNWAKKDQRIKVIHKDNGGLSDARNAGYKIASGEYISFVDSDDWIHKDFYKIMLETLLKNKSDIVECGVTKTSDFKVDDLSINAINSHDYNTENALKELINDGVFHQHVWNKLYKKEVIGDVLFEKGKLNEDEFWTYQVFGKAHLISKIDNPLYYYYQRDMSIMGQNYSLRRLDAVEAKYNREVYIEKHYPNILNYATVNLYETCIYQGQMSLKYLSKEDLNQAKKKLTYYLKKIRHNKLDLSQLTSSRKLWINLSRISFFGTCRLKNLLNKGVD